MPKSLENVFYKTLLYFTLKNREWNNCERGEATIEQKHNYFYKKKDLIKGHQNKAMIFLKNRGKIIVKLQSKEDNSKMISDEKVNSKVIYLLMIKI